MHVPTNPQELLTLGLTVLINIVITVLFCKSLIKALSFVNSENRAIQPGLIWLLLVPGLNYVLNFFVVLGLSKSISQELKSRNFEDDDHPTLVPGLIFAILSLATLVVLFVPIPPSLAVVVAVIGFSQIFFFVQYWMKVNFYKNILENDEPDLDDEGNESQSE